MLASTSLISLALLQPQCEMWIKDLRLAFLSLT